MNLEYHDPCREAIAGAALQALASVDPSAATTWSIPQLVAMIERPPDTKLGDLALPCFRFAKTLGKKPNDAAATLAEHIRLAALPWVNEVTAAGPFANFRLAPAALAGHVVPAILSGAMFSSLRSDAARGQVTVMVEYSQPNTCKEFHVGHVRNVCLGHALVELFRYAGYPTIPVNYFGDDGTHIAKVIWYLRRTKAEPPATHRGEWLGEAYVASLRTLEAAPSDERATFTAEISMIQREVEAHSGDSYALWHETRQWSLDEFKGIYQLFSAPFDHDFFESQESQPAQSIIDEFLARGTFVLSDGAIGIDLKPHGLPFLLLRKSDGNTLYAAKDLALARRKFAEFKVNRNIYVVASEQRLHFQQVFKTLELMGFSQAPHCHHLSYGMVTLPEGKMSSRLGRSVTLSKIYATMTEELESRLRANDATWTAEEISATAQKLCIAAIKYGMLATDATKNLVFKMEDWLSFEGDTGPYLVYSYARTQSILRKAEYHPVTSASSTLLGQLATEPEAALMREMYDFNRTALLACEQYRPSAMANYLFYLCKEFNRFYHDTPVLKAETPALRDARLVLVDCFGRLLERGLRLLGIEPVSRM